MKIEINHSQVEIKDSLKKYVEESIKTNIKKYFENAESSQVYFKKEGNMVAVNLTVNDGVRGNSDINIKSNAISYDAGSAFSDALEKATKQVRRYKRRLKNYKGKKAITDVIESTKYILSATPNPLLDDQNDDIFFEENKNIENFNNVVEEKKTEIQTLSVAEAIMKMDLQDLPALVFVNSQDQKKNVIYYRKDGRISIEV